MDDNPTKKSPFAALKINDFRFYIIVRFLLTIGTQMQSIIVGWQIYEYTKDAFALGMIGLAEATPFILTVLFAGHIADLVNRKKMLVVAIIALIISSFLLFYFTTPYSHILQTYGTMPIYIVILFTGVARAFYGPTNFAFMSQLVPRELYSNATTWSSAVWQSAAILGPSIGGLLYGFYGIQSAYGIDFIFIIIAFIALLFIKSKPVVKKARKETLVESLNDGIRFVFKTKEILGAISLDLFAVFFGGAVALLPIFADQILKVGPEGLGILRSAPSIGAVIMAITLTYKPPTKRAGKNLLWAVTGYGICILVFALSKNFYLSIAALAVSGAFDNISVVVRSTTLQLLTPDEMRGRVSSVNLIFIGSSNELGEFESGVTAKIFGLIPAVLIGGCLTLTITGIIAKKNKKLRELNLDEAVQENH